MPVRLCHHRRVSKNGKDNRNGKYRPAPRYEGRGDNHIEASNTKARDTHAANAQAEAGQASSTQEARTDNETRSTARYRGGEASKDGGEGDDGHEARRLAIEERATIRNGTPSNEPHETGRYRRPQPPQPSPRPTTSKAGRRTERGKTAREPHETEMSKASKPTIGARNGEAGRNEDTRRAEQRERDAWATRGGKPTPTGRSKEPHRWDDTAPPRYRQGENGKAGSTIRPNPTDETRAESKHAVGNARDGKHGTKRGRDPMTTTETRPGKQEKKRGTRGKPEHQARRKRTSAQRESDTTR